MADSIVRLVVNSSEYDQKLKRAAEGLTRYADECRKVGGTMEVVEKDTLDYVRAIGQMDTTSRTATGKLAEMKKTFTELSVVYKNMTDEEKASPFGKALATSLDQLKGRIGESKVQLDDINKSINGGGGLTGALDSLSDKFGMSVQSLAGWGTALAAGKAALDVAKDAFFASEETVDEWGRVMDSSKSLYEGFLTALNTGDISGYLSRIDSIVQAARAAYNELDRLGTMKTIQAPQMSAQQTENERMRMMIQTGRYIAPVDGRKASMQNGQLLTSDQITRIEKMLQNGMQKVVTLVGNEVAQTGRAIDAVYNRQAQELGMSLKEFRKGTSSMAEFDKRMAGYDQYQKWRAEHTTIDMQSGRETVARGNPFEQFAKWGTFRVDGDRYNDLVKLIQQRDQQAGQAYSMQSQAYRTMNRAEGITLRQIMGGGSGGGSSKTNLPTLEEFWLQMTKNDMKLQDQKAAGDLVKDMPSPYQMMFDEIKKQYLDKKDFDYGKDISKEWKVDSKENLTNKPENRVQESMARDLNKFTGYAEKTLGGVSNIVGGLSQLGVEIPKGLQDVLGGIQGITSIVTGIASLVAMIEALTTVQTTESTIKSIPVIGWALAGGGIIHAANGYVPGNNYSGDQVPALLNSGELVLNKAQQNALANELQGNGMQNMRLRTEVSGRNLIVVIENDLKARGKGQLATFK
jgi:hypothetical protein